jgi:hypothetical protein
MKMKKLITILFTLFISLHGVAKVNVILYGRPQDGIYNSNKNEIPVVTYDDNTVTVTSDSLIYDAQIVIKDEYGNIVSSTQAQLSPAQTQIPLPAEYNNGTYTIEIYYGYYNNQIRLYGEMQ